MLGEKMYKRANVAVETPWLQGEIKEDHDTPPFNEFSD